MKLAFDDDDVLHTAHKRKRHPFQFVLDDEVKVYQVLFGECRQGYLRVRKVDPFLGREDATENHLNLHVALAGDFFHHHFYLAIIDHDDVPDLHILRKIRVGDVYLLQCADHLLVREREDVAFLHRQ